MKKELQIKDSVVSYEEEGTGPAVLLIHGYDETATVWNRQKEDLKNKYHIIVPDLPGRGNSIAGKEPLTDFSSSVAYGAEQLEYYAIIIKELLTALKIEKCCLFGHSMGGYIALAFGSMFPEMLQGLGLVHSTAYEDSNEKKAKRIKNIALLEEKQPSEIMGQSIPDLFGNAFKKNHKEVVNSYIEATKLFSAEGCLNFSKAILNRPNRTEFLKKTQIPILFLIGAEDKAAPLSDLLKQVYLPKWSYMHILRGIGHMGMIEAPELESQYLDEFISTANRYNSGNKRDNTKYIKQ